MVQGKPTAAGCNMVHSDEIWKDHVQHEYTAMKTWPATWGFLQNEYKQLNKTVTGARAKWVSRSPSANDQMSPGEDLHLPPLPCPKQHSSRPFPNTTSREVGWLSTQKEKQLEIFGCWARGKGSIVKQLKWPHDAVP